MNADHNHKEDKDILALPGRAHLFKIRKALSEKHAAVMVGSGFSRNADNGERLPTWPQLAAKMAEELEPHASAVGTVGSSLPPGTSAMLRLAEEFEAIHGRASLDALLRKEVPDAGVVQPGRLHQALLALPWVDVFTTNYDTLLERAYYDDQKLLNPEIRHRYEVVATHDDIPFSRADGRPRIVKLHGGFTSHRPFIVTEEDYRTYPAEFAPFVNMVQQSLLENVFCLIGFSGDDPNFLLWTGWVRDRLGKQTPPIYLITASPISRGLRLILERRYIYPIEIADLGRAPKQNSVDYRVAYGRLLAFFAERPAPSPFEWGHMREAVEEPTNIDTLLTLIANLREIRLEYPGWLYPPRELQFTFKSKASHISKVFRTWTDTWASQLTPLARLASLYELNWWSRLGTTNYLDDWAGDAPELLDTLAPILSDEERFRNEQSNAPAQHRQSLNYFQEAWRNLALCLLAEYRRTFNHGKFDQMIERLSRLVGPLNSDEFQAAMRQELIRVNLESFNFKAATDLLAGWKKEDGDPYWLIRKASLLAEQGDCDEALSIGIQGLKKIRHQIQSDGETVRLISQEMWAVLMLELCQNQVRLSKLVADRLSKANAKPQQQEEVVDLDSLPADLRHQAYRKEFARPIADDPDNAKPLLGPDKKKDERPDHPWKIILAMRNALHIGAGIPPDGLEPSDATFESRQYRNLVDDVGLAGEIGHTRVASVELLYAAEVNARRSASPAYYIGDLLRCTDTNVFKDPYVVLSKNAIASWTEAFLVDIFSRVYKTLNTVLSAPGDPIRSDVVESRIRFGLEMLSRLIGRVLSPEMRAEIFDSLCSWYIQPGLYKRPFAFEPFLKFFTAVLASCSERELRALAPRLFGLPVIHESQRPHSSAHWRYWPDPIRLLVDHIVKLSPEDGWDDIADNIITSAANETGEVYERYLVRLDYLLRQGVLGSESKQAFGHLVWKSAMESGLPDIPGFLPAVLIDWPSPTSVNVSDRLDSVLGAQSLPNLLNSQDAINYLNNLLYLVRHQKTPLKSFNLGRALEGAIKWWEGFQSKLDSLSQKPSPMSEWDLIHPRYLARVLSYALYRACLFAGDVEKTSIAKLALDLRKSEAQLGYTYPYLLLVDVLLNELTPAECSAKLRALVGDENKTVVLDALAAVGECLTEPALKQLIGGDVATVFAEAVRWRRAPNTPDALRTIERISRQDLSAVSDKYLPDLVTALVQLLTTMKYSINEQQGVEYRTMIPECRLLVATVAGLLEARIRAVCAPYVVQKLFGILEIDPYLAVRSAAQPSK